MTSCLFLEVVGTPKCIDGKPKDWPRKDIHELNVEFCMKFLVFPVTKSQLSWTEANQHLCLDSRKLRFGLAIILPLRFRFHTMVITGDGIATLPAGGSD